MDCVLRTEDGRRAALYSAGGRLLFVWLPPFGRYGRGFDRRMEAGAAVLAEDCLSGPAACMRGDRICCAYVQRTGELVCGAFPAGALRPGMSRLNQLFPYRTCPPPEMSGADSARAGRILHPFLFPAGEGAGLLFLEETEDGGGKRRRLWLGFPFAAGTDRCGVVAGGDGSLDFEAAGLETGTALAVTEAGQKTRRFVWDGERFRGLADPGEEAAKARWQQEEQLARVRRQQEEQLAQVRRQYEEQLAQVRRQQEEQLARAGRQYEELARVTRQLQEAGRKWREMHFEEI